MNPEVILTNVDVIAVLIGGCAAALASIIGSVTLVVVAGKKLKAAIKSVTEKTVIEQQLKREREENKRLREENQRYREQNDLLLEKAFKVKQDRSR